MRPIRRLPRTWRRGVSPAPVFSAVAILALMLGCHDSLPRQDSTGSGQEEANIPSLTDKDGVEYPYFRYEASGPFLATYGWAMFVHPMFDARNKGLALTYRESDYIRSLFGEELFGRDFSVISTGGILVVDGFPISRPLKLASNSTWKMRFDGKMLECGVTAERDDGFDVACASSTVSVALVFAKDGALTSFQGACDMGMCTYTLASGGGLLSPYHLRIAMPRASDPDSRT